jgi:hypothetical protein
VRAPPDFEPLSAETQPVSGLSVKPLHEAVPQQHILGRNADAGDFPDSDGRRFQPSVLSVQMQGADETGGGCRCERGLRAAQQQLVVERPLEVSVRTPLQVKSAR